MRRSLLLLVSILAGCSKGPQADLQHISAARSLGAEWAMVNEQAAKGQLTPTYVEIMHRELRHQLQSSASALTQPDSRYGQVMRALIAQPDDAPAEELRAQAGTLKQIEDQLESA